MAGINFNLRSVAYSPGRRSFLKMAAATGIALLGLPLTSCDPQTPASAPSPSMLPKGQPIFPASGCLHAAVIGDNIPSLGDIEKYETLVEKKLAGVVWFQSSMNFSFPFANMETLGQRLPIIKWGWDGDLSSFLMEVNSGLHDQEITRSAESIRDWGHPMILMPFYECNIKLPWGGVNLGAGDDADRNHQPDGPQAYKEAFNRVVSLFRAAKANNAKFAWVVNWESDPKEKWNDFENYYPDQCDYVGFDFFNGAHLPVKKPEDILKEMVDRLKRYEKPILIGEVGVAEGGARKPFWIRDFFDALKKFPEIKMFVWFNHPKEADWQFESSEASLKMARQGLKDSHILTDFSIK